MGSNGRFEYTIGFKTDDSGLKQARQALKEIQNLSLKPETGSREITEYNSKILDAKESASQLEAALTNAFNIKMGSTSVQALNQELKKLNLNDIYTKMKAIGPEGESAFNKIALQAMQTNLQIKKGNTLLDKFGKTLWRNVEWFISGNLINAVTGVFTKAYGYTKNLDESLNNIRIVTGKGADEMARFGKEAQETAIKLGKGTTDITNASLIFYQQGLDKAEVDERTEVATKLANVSQQSAETTADQLTAVWNGFQAGTDELERYADVMTAIAANTASSSSELAGAISKVSSVAHTTGVDMEQLSAMISTVISVTRDSPETVGTAFKTIFARMDDLVEDGTDEFGVSLGRVSSHLKAMGIEILNEDGSLRDLGDTLTETGNKWSSYSREQQVAIAEQMGGKRQWNQVIALFDNWDKYKDALDVARNSTGALQEQQDTYMESTQAHLQAVKTAWEGVYSEMMTADNINTVADAFTKILNQVQSFIEALGGIKPILLTVSSLMVKSFSGQIAQGIANAANNIKIMGYNAAEMKASQELSTTFNIKDNKLLADLTPKYAALLKQKKAMNEEDVKRFSAYAKAREELNYQQQSLEKQLKTEEEIINKYNSLTSSYAEQNKDISKMSPNDFTNIKEIGQNLQSGKLDEGTSLSLDVGNKTGGSSAPTQMLQEQNKLITDQINLIEKQKIKLEEKALKEKDPSIVAALQKEFYSLDAFEQELKEASEEIVKFSVDGKITTEQLDKLGSALYGAGEYLDLQKYGKFTEVIEKIGKNIGNMAVPAETGAKQVENLISEFQRMGSEGALTTEQTDKLVKKYTELKEKLEQKPNMSLDDVRKEFQSAAETAKRVGGEIVKDMDLLISNSQKNIRQDLEGIKNQVKNFEKEYNDILSNVTFKNFIQGATNAVSAVGQLVSSFNSIKNAINIWDNDGLSGWDKFTQITQNLTMALPMLVSALLTLKTGVIDQAKAVWAAVTAKIALAGMTETEHALAIQQIIDEAALTGATLTQAEAEKILIRRKLEDAGATGILTLAWKALSLAMETNPIGTVITICALLVAAVAGVSVWLDKLNDRVKYLGTAIKVVIAVALFPFMGILAPMVVVIGSLVTKLFELGKALKKEAEAEEQLKKTREDFIQKNKELIKTIDDNIKAFDQFKEVWENFQLGIATVDELKNSLESMAEQLGVAGDEEYKRLARIAEYTEDYAPLEEYLDNIIKKQKEVAAGAEEQNAQAYGDQLSEELKKDKKDAFQGGYYGDKNQSTQGKYERALDFLEKTGAITATANNDNIYENGSAIWEEVELSPEALQKLAENRSQIEEWAASEDEDLKALGERYLKLIDDHAGTLEMWKNSVIESISKDAIAELSGELNGDTVLEKKEDLQKQIEELVSKKASEYEEKTGLKMSKEQKDKLQNQILQDYADVYPSQAAIVGAIEKQNDTTGVIDEVLNNAIAQEKNMTGRADLQLLSDKDINDMYNQLEALDIKPYEINWEEVTHDQELFSNIVHQRGKLTQEDIDNIKKYQKETADAVSYLSQNYDELSAKYDEFNSKIEKGSFNAKTFNSKAFKEFFTDDVKEELTELYGKTSDVGQAIETLSNEAIVGSKDWEEAWKVFGTALDNAEITQDVQNAQTALNQLNNHVKELDDGEIHIFAGVSVEEAGQEIDNFVNAQRTIDIDISVKAESKINTIKDTLKDVQELGSKIDENLQLSFEDFIGLEQQFPKIGEGMQILADGTIQLSQTAVDEAKKQQKENIATAVDEQIAKIEIEKMLLEEKKKKYEEAAEEAKKFAQKAANWQYKEENQLQADLNVLQGYYKDIQDISDQQERAEELQLQKNQIEDWKKYYDGVTELDAAYNKQRIKNALAVNEEDVKSEPELETPKASSFYKLTSGDIWNRAESKYTTMTYSELAAAAAANNKKPVLDNAAIEEYWNGVADSMTQGAENTQKSLDSLNATQKSLDRYKEMFSNQAGLWGKNTDVTKDNTDATKDNTDATKDNAEAQQELIDLLNEEIDAYHDLNNELKILGIRLDKVKKQQSKLVDQDLKNNLNKQIDILNQYMETDQRYLDKLNTDAALKRIQLEEYGVTFNEDGAIANYSYSDTLLKAQDELRAKQEWYNSLSKEEQEWAKEQLEAQEKSYEQLKDLITEYEDILLEQIPNMVNDISDKFDEKIEAQISIWKIDIDLKLNEASKKRTRLEFQQFMADIAEEDILGNTAYTMNTLATYLGKNGDIQVTRQQYEELLEMKKRLEGGDTSTIYGDNMAKLQEDLDSAEQSWMESEKAAKELQKTIKDNLLKLYDQAAEKLKEQRNLYKEISDILDHDMNLIKLRFGDASFGKLSNLLEQQKQLAYKQLNSALAERDYYGEQLQKALDKDPNMKEKVTQELATHFREAVNTASSLTIELVEKIKSGFENTFNEIFANAMEKITGESNLAVLTSEWDRAKESAEKYYDTINGAYEIEKLQLQIQKEINNSNDPAYQKRLTTFMRDQVQLLRSKDKLSKYDVERANALFDIEIKRAAFQEAQNNKTKMRLRRDSSGNYSYQFVSDENNVQDAITALAEAQNKLYNIDKDAFKDNVEDVQKILSDMQQKLLEDAQNGGRRQNEIQQYYIGLITNLVKDNEEIRQNYQATTFDQLSKLTEQGIEDFYKLGQSEREALMIAQDPLFGAGLAKALETPERFLSTLNTTVEETKELTLNYMNEFDDVMDRVEKNWEDLVKGSDPMVDGITTLTTSTEELIQQITTDTEKLVECVDQLSNHSLNLANTWELLGDAVADVLDLFNGGVGFTDSLMQILEDAKKVIKDVRNTDEMNSVSNGTNNNQTSQFNSNQNIQNKKVFSSEEWPQIGDKVRYLGGQYYEDSQGNGQAGDRGLGNFVEVYNIQKDAPYPISVISNNSAYGWLKKDQIAKFDNGGYTGNWETTKGKLAVLHPQELVLNASQTKGLVSFLNSKIHELSANALRGIVTPNIGSRHLVTESPQITNVNNIEANFPNVSVASEIEKAFMDLENLATQNAFKIYN